jgi:hypothetical protein
MIFVSEAASCDRSVSDGAAAERVVEMYVKLSHRLRCRVLDCNHHGSAREGTGPSRAMRVTGPPRLIVTEFLASSGTCTSLAGMIRATTSIIGLTKPVGSSVENRGSVLGSGEQSVDYCRAVCSNTLGLVDKR